MPRAYRSDGQPAPLEWMKRRGAGKGRAREQVRLKRRCARVGPEEPVGEDAIPSIEIVLGLAVAVLGARAVALFQAAIHVPEVQGRLLAALSKHDPQLTRLVRNLGFQSPYAELAGTLIRTTQAASPEERPEVLHRTSLHARAAARRRLHRGQALDLVALALAVGIAAFARDGLPAGTLFWALGGALLTVLVLTLLARGRLHGAIRLSLRQLEEALTREPAALGTGRASKPGICPTCGQELPAER